MDRLLDGVETADVGERDVLEAVDEARDRRRRGPPRPRGPPARRAVPSLASSASRRCRSSDAALGHAGLPGRARGTARRARARPARAPAGRPARAARPGSAPRVDERPGSASAPRRRHRPAASASASTSRSASLSGDSSTAARSPSRRSVMTGAARRRRPSFRRRWRTRSRSPRSPGAVKPERAQPEDRGDRRRSRSARRRHAGGGGASATTADCSSRRVVRAPACHPRSPPGPLAPTSAKRCEARRRVSRAATRSRPAASGRSATRDRAPAAHGSAARLGDRRGGGGEQSAGASTGAESGPALAA